jgi:DNA-binding MarR family transcriptional regulator
MTEFNQKTIETVIDNLLYLHPLLSKNFSKQVRAKTNLNPGSWFILSMLCRHEKLSMSELGKKLSMPNPHVTVLIDKLIELHFVERLPDSNDRRIVHIHITPKGVAQFKKIKKEISKEMHQQLEELSPEQLNTLATATQQVREILLLIFKKSPECHEN